MNGYHHQDLSTNIENSRWVFFTPKCTTKFAITHKVFFVALRILRLARSMKKHEKEIVAFIEAKTRKSLIYFFSLLFRPSQPTKWLVTVSAFFSRPIGAPSSQSQPIRFNLRLWLPIEEFFVYLTSLNELESIDVDCTRFSFFFFFSASIRHAYFIFNSYFTNTISWLDMWIGIIFYSRPRRFF